MMEGRCYHRTAGLSSRSVKPPASKRDITAVTLPPPWQGQRHQHQSLRQWNTLAQLGACHHILPVLSFWRSLIMGLLYFPILHLLGFCLNILVSRFEELGELLSLRIQSVKP